jgi:hypothetical protein
MPSHSAVAHICGSSTLLGLAWLGTEPVQLVSPRLRSVCVRGMVMVLSFFNPVSGDVHPVCGCTANAQTVLLLAHFAAAEHQKRKYLGTRIAATGYRAVLRTPRHPEKV